MANQIINVVVNSKGAVTVARELDRIGDSARTTTTYLNGLRAILAAALTFSGAGQIIETIDNFTVLQNRLRQVSDETTNVASSWTKLMEIANNSYSTIDNTVNLYFRVAQAYRAWGEAAEQAYEFTDLFQKAAVLSGSSVQTTSQAVYQFSQALNKGKLDGDEFRSVLEGLPYVANVIQKSLGVTRSELYEMSKDGQITVDRIKQAFESAADTIRGDWGNITPTIAMALIVLKNNWTDFLGSVQTSTGIFSGFAYLILAVANNFNLLAIALAPVVASITFLGARLGIGLVVIGLKDMYAALRPLITLIWTFNAALLANPLGLIAVTITGVIAAVVYFREELGLTDEVLQSMWNSISAFFSSLLGFFSPTITAISQIVDLFFSWNDVIATSNSSIEQTGITAKETFSSIGEIVAALVSYMGSTLGPLFTELGKLALEYFNLWKEIAGLFVDVVTPAIQLLLPTFKLVWEFVQPALLLFITLLKNILEGWQFIVGYLRNNFFPIVKEVFEGWIIILKTVIQWVTNIIEALRTAINLLRQLSGLKGGGSKPGGAHYGAQFKAGEGFATGGQFKVGGTGAGRDTTPVAFRAERGERVTVETKKQQRENDNSAGSTPSVNVDLKTVNVVDPSMVPAAMQTSQGQKAFLNMINANRNEIRNLLGAY